MGSRQVYALLSALLFTAVSAWLGAAVFTALQRPRPPAVQLAAPSRSGMLEGIVLRREQGLEKALAAKDAERISAGEHCAQSAIFLTHCDGYEQLSPAMAQELDVEKLKELMCQPKKPAAKSKLIYGFDFYYAAYYYGSEDIQPGPCRVRFEGMKDSLRAELISLSREGGDCAVLLRLLLCPECIDLRFCKAELEY